IPQELEKLQAMIDYCHTESCLQNYIIKYFGDEALEPCGRCSNCTDSRTAVDVTTEVQMVLSCVIRMGQRYGKSITAQVLTGSKNKKITEFGFHTLSTYGIMKEKSAKEVTNFIEFLISQELLGVEQGTYPTIFVTSKGKEVLLGQQRVERKEAVQTKQITADDPLFEELRSLRKSLADEAGVPPFVIFSDRTLKDMCLKLPQTEAEFLTVSGVGSTKLENYGQFFMTVISDFCEKNPERERDTNAEPAPPKKKVVGQSHLDTYELHRQNLTVDEIAEKRQLAVSTIENHLLQCAEEGMKVELSLIVPKEDWPLLQEAIREEGRERLKPIKERVPESITYGMIKAFLTIGTPKEAGVGEE
ncbi:MAG TPA: RQC domain-containing protein, partial [Pseudobacillus sp.]